MAEPTTTTHPIDPARFAAALEALPIDAIHNKAAEIRNNIMQLRYSNEQMIPFADEGDADCKEAMFENLSVIGRMNERLGLLKAEVEGRGMMWAGHEEDLKGEDVEMEGGDVDMVNGGLTNGATANGDHGVSGGSGTEGEQTATRAPSGRLTDEELRRQLEAQMEDAEDEEDGVHL